MRQTQRVEGQITGAVAFITRQAARAVADQVASPAVPTAGSAASLPALSSPPTPTWTPHAGQTAAVNIEQLTDQVMRQMDRRMTAWRERRGRI
jgi:hypothetical protein